MPLHLHGIFRKEEKSDSIFYSECAFFKGFLINLIICLTCANKDSFFNNEIFDKLRCDGVLPFSMQKDVHPSKMSTFGIRWYIKGSSETLFSKESACVEQRILAR